MAVTSWFRHEEAPTAPICVVECVECGLVQLLHTVNPAVFYHEDYGYRSGLNPSMVGHLRDIALFAQAFVELEESDLWVDIGSSDGTLLSHAPKIAKIGVDPVANNFRSMYPEDVAIQAGYFRGGFEAKVITSIAMLYDLDDPTEFASLVSESLTDDGVWVFEVGYLPAQYINNAYDGFCHEHLTYYDLSTIRHLLNSVGLKLVDVQFNDTNGGSVLCAAMKRGFDCLKQDAHVVWDYWADRMRQHRYDLMTFLERHKGECVGYGASTKGNVILQYCGITQDLLPAIVDVNPDKHGKLTPGTNIPITMEPQDYPYNVVLPWHFERDILSREQGQFVFPLPDFHISNSRADAA